MVISSTTDDIELVLEQLFAESLTVLENLVVALNEVWFLSLLEGGGNRGDLLHVATILASWINGLTNLIFKVVFDWLA